MSEQSVSDAPSVVAVDGRREWTANGRWHREVGPAIEWPDGFRLWYVNGKRHRDGGPAVEGLDGHCEWFVDGERHREDGPAVVGSDGSEQWWLVGSQVSREVFDAYRALSSTAQGVVKSLLRSGARPNDALAATRVLGVP